MKIRNTFIIFIVSGFWHGANWTFIVWGALNAIYFLPLLLANKNRSHLGTVADGKYLPTLKETLCMLATFLLTVVAWVFFRAENMTHAMSYLNEIFSLSFFQAPYFKDGTLALPTLGFLMLFLVIEWMGRENQYALENFAFKAKRPIRIISYYVIIISIIWGAGRTGGDFIYFQF